uniref:Dynamin N-terminal domain-containing protein n=1 Tax=viral metagenome TaxID=1070528 RepID=A0A6C0IRI5_9ZZZZ
MTKPNIEKMFKNTFMKGPNRKHSNKSKMTIQDTNTNLGEPVSNLEEPNIHLLVSPVEETENNSNNNKPLVPPVDNINICFVGGVSTGKSTILNAIFCEELTQCKIKRTTMVPTIYIENESNPFHITPSEEIFKVISEKNKEIIQKTEDREIITKDEYSELIFNVGKLDINILDDAYVNVYDIPGLNDAKTKNIYYDYLEENFLKFNLVIFIVDIHSGLNTSDEIDIVNFITNNTRYQLEKNNKKIYTLVVVNKADDMQPDNDSEDTDKLILTGELNEMYEQVEKTIKSEFERKNVKEHLIGIMPLCAIDSYLYRMVKKHGNDFKLSPEQILKIGINENGKKFSTLKPAVQEKKVYDILQDKEFIDTMIKLSGFSCLEKTLHKFLGENNTGKTIRINNLLYKLSQLPDILKIINDETNLVYSELLDDLFDEYFEIYDNIKKIDEEKYYSLCTELLDDIVTIIKIKSLNYKGVNELIDDYYTFSKNTLCTYFEEFYNEDDNKFPEYIETQVLEIYKSNIRNDTSFTINNIVSILTSLYTLNMNSNTNIYRVVSYIIGRSHNFKYALNIEEKLDMSNNKFNELLDNDEDNYSKFIELLNNIKSQGINIDTINTLLRFVLIYKIKDSSDNIALLYAKKMLYQSHNEIPVSNYISQMLYGKEADEIIFINGLDISEYENELKLDLYYLNNLNK